MTFTQFLVPSLAAGLVAAGLGVGSITAPAMAEASGLRPMVSPAVRTTAAPLETASLFSSGNACTLIMLFIKGRLTPEENYKLCLSEAPSPARQTLKVAMVFGI